MFSICLDRRSFIQCLEVKINPRGTLHTRVFLEVNSQGEVVMATTSGGPDTPRFLSQPKRHKHCAEVIGDDLMPPTDHWEQPQSM